MNIVAVPDHVFHRFPYDLLFQVSATQFCCFPLASMAHIDDASDRPVPKSPVQFTSSTCGSLNGSGSDLDGMGTRPGITADVKLDALLSKFAHFEALISRIGCPEWNHTSQMHLEDLRLDFPGWNRISAPSLHACARSKQVLPLPQMFPDQQDLGPHLNRLMAPQPQARSAVLLRFPCE